MDYLNPGDPQDPEAYKPMVWKNERWSPEDSALMQASWPSIKFDTDGARLSTGGKWTDKEFLKIPVLIFIAPKAGTYYLGGEAKNHPDQGTQNLTLLVVKRDATTIDVKEEMEIPKGEVRPLPKTPIELAEGQEIALVPYFKGYHNSAFVELIGFKISDEAPAN